LRLARGRIDRGRDDEVEAIGRSEEILHQEDRQAVAGLIRSRNENAQAVVRLFLAMEYADVDHLRGAEDLRSSAPRCLTGRQKRRAHSRPRIADVSGHVDADAAEAVEGLSTRQLDLAEVRG